MPDDLPNNLPNNLPDTAKSAYIYVLSVLLPMLFFLLYSFRVFDNNRLTNWNWIFIQVSAAKVFFLIMASVLLVHALRRFELFTPWKLFFLSFGVSMFFWGVPEVIVDSSRYFSQAKHLALYGTGSFFREWGGEIFAWTDLPALPFIYGWIFKLFGESRLAVQVFTSAMFSGTVALTCLTGRDLWDQETGTSGGAMLLAMPYLMSQTPLMLVDVGSMFFLSLSIFSFNRALDKGAGVSMRVLSTLSIALCGLSKYSMWPMLSVLAVVLGVKLIEGNGGERRGAALRGAALLVAPALLAGVFLLYRFDVVSAQVELIASYQGPGLKRWSESYVSTFLFQVHPIVTGLAVFSVYAAIRKRDLKYVVVIWLLLLMAVMQVKRARYMVPVFPMFALMAAYGLRGRLGSQGARRLLVLCTLVASLSVAGFAYLPFLKTMSSVNLKAAGRYIDTLEAENVRVFTLPQKSVVNPSVSVPVLDLHTNKQLLYKHNLWGMGPPEDLATSPLRFTWEYQTPEYYNCPECDGKENQAIAVITSSMDTELPGPVADMVEGYSVRNFHTSTGLFHYKTLVRVYHSP